MNKDIAKPQASNVTTPADSNPFLDYADAVSRTSIVGQLLRFTKGDYLAGQDDVEVPVGTQLVANMDEFLVGWIRWQDNKPTDQVMGKVAERYQPPKRHDPQLGDTDKSHWEVDDRGEPRDPWRLSNYLLMKSLGDDDEPGELFTFTTSSKGGIGALGHLMRAYGQAMAQHPKEYPIVALGVDAYNHPNKAYGRIKVPVFKIVGWSKKSDFGDVTVRQDGDLEDDVAEESQDQIVEFPEPVKAAPQKGKPRGRV